MSTPIEVLVLVPFSEELITQLQAVSPRLHINILKVNKPDEIPLEIWQKVEILYTENILPDPDHVPNLKWIQFHWAGLDRLLHEPVVKKPGLLITSLSGGASPQVAEFVMSMILALGHHLPETFDLQQKGDWPKDRMKRFIPQEVSTSTVGIVGYGSIGREIGRLLHAFGATILATKRDLLNLQDSGYSIENLGDSQGDFVRRFYPPQAIKSMLKECDFVVISVPLTNETKGMFGEEELEAMKPTAFLINASRGSVINQTALVNTITEKKIGGAALDVFEQEPLPPDHPLWKLPNVIITPHIAGISNQYDQRAVALFNENLQRYLNSQPLLNQVSLERGY
jgi:phosphoglycerate dehydrogenase-like enzyme